MCLIQSLSAAQVCKHHSHQLERDTGKSYALHFNPHSDLLLLNNQCIVSVCADTQSEAAWRSEVSELLKALLNQRSKAMVPQDFSTVGSTQANRILASLEIMECVGNELDPIVVSESAPASCGFDFSQYDNESAGNLDLLKHHQAELAKFGVKFGRGAFAMYDLHVHENPYPIVHNGQEFHGGLAGGIAPHGLVIPSAAYQLRVAYMHKQSNAQKQRYCEHHGDIAQVLFTCFTQACMFVGPYNVNVIAYCLMLLVCYNACMCKAEVSCCCQA